ncbi:MAG: twin-arginine translocase TatA/TatE family subunit [Hydrogenophilaceae bacterium]|jgi:sec-independent protein translocase protein TatA|nr:twin-arginine translocase TatA/TatE family subunit [Hydrogenophilaceae bacterium]
MHFPGLIPLLIVVFLAFLLFGRPGRLSGLMEDLGKGIRGFRKGLSDPNAAKDEEAPPPQVTAEKARESARESDRTNA